MADALLEYRKKVFAKHRDAFRFHTEVLGGIEKALLIPRSHRSLERLVLDMLMLQSFKSNATVSLLAQHGLMEDTATIVRRLLELGVAAVYIGAESDRIIRKRRCGMYLAFLWRQLPPRIRRRLPIGGLRRRSSVARRYARFVPAKAHRWGPNWFEMFKEIGQEKQYRRDYSFLSSIAHGSSDHQVFAFSSRRIRLHDDRFASVLLIHATRYCLAAVEQWNRRFRLLDKATFDKWVQQSATWRQWRTRSMPDRRPKG
jgi:hypothetical protein